MTKRKVISTAMKAMLRNIAAGKPSTFGLKGQSAYGGATGTMAALYRHDLLDEDGNLTHAGRAAIAMPARKPAKGDDRG